MATRLTQALVNSARDDHPQGTQVYDSEMSGLRLVVGRRSSSFKLVGRINDGTGRYVSVLIGRADEVSLRKARERAAELRLALRRGEDPRTPRRAVPTLGQAWERYRDARAGELRPQTVDWYERKVAGPLRPLRDVPMDRIDREAVRSLHERLTRSRGPYCANGAMRALKAIHNDCARSCDLPPNPVTRAVRMNKERARDWAIGPGELPAMWRALDAMGDRTRAACWLAMLLTGLRSGDARSMRWESLDGDGVLLVPSPKGGPDRSFRTPLPRLLLQELERVRQETAPLESPFVFPSPSSGSGHVEQARRTAEFPYAPHQMRHMYRTAALEAGVDMQTVVMLMNHRPAGVTWGYVTRAHLLGHMREAQERVCAAIAAHRGRQG